MNIISQWLNMVFFGDMTDKQKRNSKEWWDAYANREKIWNQAFQDELQRLRNQ